MPKKNFLETAEVYMITRKYGMRHAFKISISISKIFPSFFISETYFFNLFSIILLKSVFEILLKYQQRRTSMANKSIAIRSSILILSMYDNSLSISQGAPVNKLYDSSLTALSFNKTVTNFTLNIFCIHHKYRGNKSLFKGKFIIKYCTEYCTIVLHNRNT